MVAGAHGPVDVADLADQGGMRGVIPAMPGEQGRSGVKQEGHDYAGGLGQGQCLFHRVVGRALITEARVPNLEIVTNVFEDPTGESPTRIRSSVIGVTPGGPQLCYQINAQVNNYIMPGRTDFNSPETQKMIQRITNVIHQDRDILGAVQRNYNEAGDDLVEVSVLADNAAMRFRRLMIEMINSERAQ